MKKFIKVGNIFLHQDALATAIKKQTEFAVIAAAVTCFLLQDSHRCCLVRVGSKPNSF